MLYMLYLTSTKRSADEQCTYVILDVVFFFSILALCYVFGRTKWWGRKKVAFLYIFFSVKDSHKSFWQSILVIIELSIYNDVRTLSGFFFYTKTQTNDTLYASLSYWQTLCNGFLYKVLKKVRSKNQFELKAF